MTSSRRATPARLRAWRSALGLPSDVRGTFMAASLSRDKLGCNARHVCRKVTQVFRRRWYFRVVLRSRDAWERGIFNLRVFSAGEPRNQEA
jgi:hypothetical protein